MIHQPWEFLAVPGGALGRRLLLRGRVFEERCPCTVWLLRALQDLQEWGQANTSNNLALISFTHSGRLSPSCQVALGACGGGTSDVSGIDVPVAVPGTSVD